MLKLVGKKMFTILPTKLVFTYLNLNCSELILLLSFSEEEKHREFVKHKILERKEKARLGIREPNILTWAARTQIRSLHEEDPYQWTPEVLADSFPVSKQTILKILRSRWLPEDEEAIKRYDRDAHQNWLKLKADLEDSKMLDTSKENKMLVDEKISKLINAAGVPSFPLPHMEDVALTRKKLVEKLHPQATGQFSSIISNYKAQFKITEVKSIGSVDKPENVGVAIGDKDSVQLLSQITALNEKRAKQKDNSDISDRMEDKDRVTEATEKSNLHKNKLSETKGRDFDVNRSRRQRRLGEVEVSSDNLEHLQMLGTQKIS